MVKIVNIGGVFVTYERYLEDAISLEVETTTPRAHFVTEWTYVIPTDKLVLQQGQKFYHASGEIEPFDDIDFVHYTLVNMAIDRLLETIKTEPIPSFAINGYSN